MHSIPKKANRKSEEAQGIEECDGVNVNINIPNPVETSTYSICAIL